MYRNLLTAIASGSILCTVLLSALHSHGSDTETKDLHPFTNVAYIPVGADRNTIRFEKVKVVMVPTKIRYTTDTAYCAGAALRDPGGSAFCPSVALDSSVLAYEVTYSFDGPPMASDDRGTKRFTFQVYFRPEDLTLPAREAFSGPKRNRAKLAEYFAINTRRETLARPAIDERQSSFCEGNYADGNWIHRDANCADNIAYRTTAAPADYITVRIDPVSPGRALAAIAPR